MVGFRIEPARSAVTRKGKVLKRVGLTLLVLVVLVVAFGGWARSAAEGRRTRQVETHAADFPVPFPLTDAELDALRAAAPPHDSPDPPANDGARNPNGVADGTGAEGAATGDVAGDAEPAAATGGDDALPTRPAPAPPDLDVNALAASRAVARGEHLVRAIYACSECHGDDFSGGVMVDDPALGRLLGPNLTMGEGGVTADFTPSDWDRIVRHGVRHDGTPAVMPSEDYARMSTRELSDIIAYIRAQPPVDNVVPPVELGPVGTVLIALGELPLSADTITDHQAPHETLPPASEANAEYGEHLAAVCTGCHRATLVGGPIASGDPSWIPAANLTPHEAGLGQWSFEDFDTAMREGRRPDGSSVRDPMSRMTPYAQRMSEVEMRALWAYLQSLPAQPTGE